MVKFVLNVLCRRVHSQPLKVIYSPFMAWIHIYATTSSVSKILHYTHERQIELFSVTEGVPRSYDISEKDS